MRGRRLMLLAPLLLTGCDGVPGGLASDDAADREPGPSWVVVAQGRATATPSAPGRPRPSATSTGLPALRPPPPAPPPTPEPRCADRAWRVGVINGLTVVPGPGTATVTWTHVGGTDVVSYEVSAVAQQLANGRQRDLGWQTVTPGTAACRTMTATITGLRRGAPYSLVLEAVVRRGDVTRRSTVARSLVVHTT